MLARIRSSRLVRWGASALYVLGLGVYMWFEGVPLGRERLLPRRAAVAREP